MWSSKSEYWNHQHNQSLEPQPRGTNATVSNVNDLLSPPVLYFFCFCLRVPRTFSLQAPLHSTKTKWNWPFYSHQLKLSITLSHTLLTHRPEINTIQSPGTPVWQMKQWIPTAFEWKWWLSLTKYPERHYVMEHVVQINITGSGQDYMKSRYY